LRTYLVAGLSVLSARIAVTAAAAQVVPAATWLPAVRRLFPSLYGLGARDHVALTFDDGPNPVSTPAFLEMLGAYGVRATFFVVGERVREAPELMQRAVAEGHEIGIHGWQHRYTFTHSPHLARCVDVVGEVAAVRPLWFRPPYGVMSATSLIEARVNGLTPVLWSRWAKDWEAATTPESIHRRLSPRIAGGATLLLHDAGSPQAPQAWRATLEALPRIFRDCRDAGLRVGTLAEHRISGPSG
jgi:peptidoglycan-N-acetylglucosamine deacetylase